MNADTVRARCLYARKQIMGKSQKVAAQEMGYKNTTTISKMEGDTSKTNINHQYLWRLAMWAQVPLDYLYGRVDYPELDPQGIENVMFYHEFKRLITEKADEFSKSVVALARDKALEWHVQELNNQITMLKNSLNRFRELNPTFEEEMRGGNNLVIAVDRVSKQGKLALKEVERKTGEHSKRLKRLESALAEENHSRQIDYIGRA